jgi:hypothetical protein
LNYVQYLTVARGISQRREIAIGRRVQYYQEAAALCKASPLSEETQVLLGNMDQKLEVLWLQILLFVYKLSPKQ